MKKLFFFAFAALLFAACSDDDSDSAKTPVTVNFENAQLGADGYLWGKPQAVENPESGVMEFSGAIYTDKGVSFLSYFSDFGGGSDTWSRFTISGCHDKTTEGLDNQFSVFTEREDGMNKFAVGFDGSGMLGPGIDFSPVVKFAAPVRAKALYMANATWTYLHLTKEGQYADFSVDVIGYNGTTETGRVNVALAANETVVKDWIGADLSSLGTLTSLAFRIVCEDSQAPAYFCMDNLTFIK